MQASDLNVVLSSVVEAVAEGICIVDEDSVVQYANREMERILGVSREDLTGRLVSDMTDELLDSDGLPIPRSQGAARLAMARRRPVYNVEQSFRRADGEVVNLSVNAAPLRGAGGAVTGAVLSIRDITDRIRADAELRQSQERLTLLMGNAPIALVALDHSGRITFAEGRALQAFGMKGRDLIGGSVFDSKYARSDAVRAMRQALGGDHGINRIHSSTLDIDLELRTQPLEDEVGGGLGLICVFVDVTDRTRAEAAAQESLEQLLVADRSRRQLIDRLVTAQEEERRRIAGDMHDDSLQVMAAISLRMARVRARTDNQRTRESMDELQATIELAATRLRHLLFNLRPPVLDREGVAAALREYLEQLRDDAGVRYRLHDRLDSQPSVQQRTNLFRIAQEALANVRKHAAASRVDVTLDSRWNGTLLSVRDDGQGFDPDRGRRPDSLGLLAMNERAEMMGGWCEIHSAEGEGTRVRVWLPDPAQVQTA